MREYSFEGFWVLSSNTLESVPRFKAVLQARISREVTLKYETKVNLMVTQLEFLQKWNENYFTKVVRKHENPTASGNFYFLPRYVETNGFAIEKLLKIAQDLQNQTNLLKTIEEMPTISPLKSIRNNLEMSTKDIGMFFHRGK